MSGSEPIGGGAAPEEEEIERRDTGLRILLTILFVIVAGVLESVLAVVVVFEILWALVTRRPPNPRVRDFANRVVAYYYRIGRYLTYNESRIPFPFSEFPPAVEPEAWRPEPRESEALGLPQAERRDEGGGAGDDG